MNSVICLKVMKKDSIGQQVSALEKEGEEKLDHENLTHSRQTKCI